MNTSKEITSVLREALMMEKMEVTTEFTYHFKNNEEKFHTTERDEMLHKKFFPALKVVC